MNQNGIEKVLLVHEVVTLANGFSSKRTRLAALTMMYFESGNLDSCSR